MNVQLEPCPFCGEPLWEGGGRNPYGRCETGDCWMNARRMVVPLDDHRQVSQWNTRPGRSGASDDV
jgi:hypothetical protein